MGDHVRSCGLCCIHRCERLCSDAYSFNICSPKRIWSGHFMDSTRSTHRSIIFSFSWKHLLTILICVVCFSRIWWNVQQKKPKALWVELYVLQSLHLNMSDAFVLWQDQCAVLCHFSIESNYWEFDGCVDLGQTLSFSNIPLYYLHCCWLFFCGFFSLS